jgi:hypothetical protein
MFFGFIYERKIIKLPKKHASEFFGGGRENILNQGLRQSNLFIYQLNFEEKKGGSYDKDVGNAPDGKMFYNKNISRLSCGREVIIVSKKLK